jgi:electron transport complex protein RnfD
MKKTGWIVTPSPFILTRPTVTRMSVVTIATLVPLIVMLIIDSDYGALVNMLCSTAGCVAAELTLSIPTAKKRPFDAGTILAGFLVGLLLPSGFNPFLSFVVAFVGLLVGKVLFGGQGSFWMNPVAIAIGIAFISQTALFPQALVSADGFRNVGSAFGALKLDHFTMIDADQSITSSMNSGFLGSLGIRLPEGYVTLFLGSPSPIPAFRYNILILVASIVLLSMEIINFIVPLCFLVTYGLCALFLSMLPFSHGFTGGDILFAMLTSGTLFTAFYLLPEYSTLPRTRAGKSISGIIAGLAAFMMCGPGGSSAGNVFAVLIVNAINPVIEHFENRHLAVSGEQA